MGAHHRTKYTVLRHWLIHKSRTGSVRLQMAEERPNIDPGSASLVVFRRDDQIGGYSPSQYDGEYLYPQRNLQTTVS